MISIFHEIGHLYIGVVSYRTIICLHIHSTAVIPDYKKDWSRHFSKRGMATTTAFRKANSSSLYHPCTAISARTPMPPGTLRQKHLLYAREQSINFKLSAKGNVGTDSIKCASLQVVLSSSCTSGLFHVMTLSGLHSNSITLVIKFTLSTQIILAIVDMQSSLLAK